VSLAALLACSPATVFAAELRTGAEAMSDWSTDAPGVRRKITVDDLPTPYATESARNNARAVARPDGARPQAPAGFRVNEFASDLKKPRLITTAPNGDIFVAESDANRIRVLRDTNGDGAADVNEVFTTDVRQPFGIAFYPLGDEPTFVYVANTGSVVRFPYRADDLKANGAPEMIVENVSAGGRLTGGGHWTRDIVFSQDGQTLFLSVGSLSNVDDDQDEARRARIFAYNPSGGDERVYAWGIRNPVGLAIDPATGALWTSVNERDGLGDDLPPDYITRVKEGGFYGWPWYYLGANQDPRHQGKRPDVASKVVVPDVLIQAHSASLDLVFYTGEQFPSRYRGNIFAAEHGSWNREKRTGYKVIMVPVRDGAAAGEYEDFLTGFVTPEGNVWGRPVGVTVANDGALLVSDDGSNMIWRVAHQN
ncbi:MAG TPA: sorbosone dehydrogenase family protein, partial [Opitutus sp.]|nr:sorbosone dehydrogenase family protein [Opitutus sp.]